MVVDITLYTDRVLVRFVYNHGDASQWIDYPDGTKEKAIQMIEKWYHRYQDVLDACNITVYIHDRDYSSAYNGK